MSTIAPLARLGRLAVDLLYPPRCALCGRGGVFLCPACSAELPAAEGRRCDACWMPIHGAACESCRAQAPAFATLRAPFRYEGEVHRLVHAFKYGGQSALAASLAAPMAALQRQRPPVDLIAPVPLSGRRRRQRGFNQAALLARQIGTALDLAVDESLERRRSSPPQAQSAGVDERRRNVAGAFRVRDAAAVAGRRVLLIDDVATTGATLDECARVLLAAGAEAVTALTFARED